MKILVFGSSGQMGSVFLDSVPKKFEIIAPLRNEVDLTIEDSIQKFIYYYKPNVILNFAAFTDVDGSEKNQATDFRYEYRSGESLLDIGPKEDNFFFLKPFFGVEFTNDSASYFLTGIYMGFLYCIVSLK